MDTKVINFSNTDNFVSNEYLQSKKIFDSGIGPIKQTITEPIPSVKNPFSISYETG